VSDEAIVDRLVQVRGIGRWTVQMLLIFRLGRPDVLPVDDFGVRQGFQLTYGKRAMPTPRELARHGERWRPFRTIGAWYMWRAVEMWRGEKSEGRA
jgi:DNA-3-methyladenine glycosylase II